MGAFGEQPVVIVVQGSAEAVGVFNGDGVFVAVADLQEVTAHIRFEAGDKETPLIQEAHVGQHFFRVVMIKHAHGLSTGQEDAQGSTIAVFMRPQIREGVGKGARKQLIY